MSDIDMMRMSLGKDGIMEGFDKAIVQLLPPHERPKWRDMRAAQDAHERDLRETVRSECLEAAKRCLDAALAPTHSLNDVSKAIAYLLKAREAAQELDPKEAA